MKLSKGYFYTVLCEDRQMQTFTLHFLKHQGISTRQIRMISVPGKKGSGEAYVKKHIKGEILELKKKNYKRNALIVLTDADNLSVEERIDSLEKQVGDIDLLQEERLLIWIPKRHIETWIAYLREDEGVNEEKSYYHSEPIGCRNESVKMSRLFQNDEDIFLPSMAYAKDRFKLFCGYLA